MVAGQLLDLFGLLVDDVGGVCEVVVDKLLICLVDEGCEEEDGGRDEGQTPDWNDLYQIVGQESSNEGSSRGRDVLCKNYALRLNDEEVEEVVDITENSIKSLP